MKKNYRKIPDFIKNKVQTLNNNIVVAAIFDLTRDDFRNSIFSGLNTYSGAYPFTFRQPIKHKIAFKSTILYPFIP